MKTSSRARCSDDALGADGKPFILGRDTASKVGQLVNSAVGPALSLQVVGACLMWTKVVFETYVERVLAPSLSSGQVMVMDDLGAHKGERVRQLIEGRVCSLLFLPPYLPDCSPLEEAFSKGKALLRKAGARDSSATYPRSNIMRTVDGGRFSAAPADEGRFSQRGRRARSYRTRAAGR